MNLTLIRNILLLLGTYLVCKSIYLFFFMYILDPRYFLLGIAIFFITLALDDFKQNGKKEE